MPPTPEDPKAVDHRGVRVGPDQGVRVRLPAPVREHDTRQVLEVDLVADAGVRRHDLQLVEGPLAPPEELVPLGVALELELGVAPERLRRAVDIGDHGMVDDQLCRDEGADPIGVAADGRDGFAHGRQVDHGGYTGEVLHKDARGHEGDLVLGLAALPPGERLDVGGPDADAVLVAQEVLEEHAQRIRELTAEVAQPVHLERPAPHVEPALCPEAVGAHGPSLAAADGRSARPLPSAR
jgi:hypothetical protein